MYIEVVPNRNSPPAILLRESFREDGKVKKRTLLNMSNFPTKIVEGFRAVLKGTAVPGDQAIQHPEAEISLSDVKPHGAAAAVVGMIRKIGLERMIDSRPSRERNVIVAMIADRLLHGGSKLSTARHCHHETSDCSLGAILHLEDLTERDCYEAMDWLFLRKAAIEQRLAHRHLKDGGSVFFDLSSSYFEGHCCPLAKHGYSRDHRGDLPQVNYGLYCNDEGTPFAIDILPGNEGDRVAFPETVKRVRQEFSGKDVIFVGDRGMIGGKIIDESLRGTDGAEWITCLNNASIAKLARQEYIQLGIFDETDICSFAHPDHPDERLVACRNPLLADERSRKRNELLDATDEALMKLKKRLAAPRCRIRGKDKVGIEIGKIINRKKMAKHYLITVADDTFTFERDEEKIATEAALDGLYVVRTSLAAERMPEHEVVAHYKKLAAVERAFRSMKSIDIAVRPIVHYTENRVRTHIFLCMLAYYVEVHMRRAMAPVLFHDEEDVQQDSPVAPAQRSQSAKTKDAAKRTVDRWPVVSFRDGLGLLNCIVRGRINLAKDVGAAFYTTSRPQQFQRHIISLLGVERYM